MTSNLNLLTDKRGRLIVNFRLLCYSLGSLLLILSGSMLVPLLAALYYGEERGARGWGLALLLTFGVAMAMRLPFRKNHGQWGRREGYLVVAAIWAWFAAFSAMGFMLVGATDSFADAFFESVSGFTTTGASIFPNVEVLPHHVLLWRAFMQWMGGMGIILLSIVFGFGGIQIYVAEVSGPVKGKISPRLRETAFMLWKHYFSFTVVILLLFILEGMDYFDALCQTLSLVSTGGFSTHNSSMGFWPSPLIQYTAVATMLFSCINFSVSYFYVPWRGRKPRSDEEVRHMFWSYGVFAAVCAVVNLACSAPGGFLQAEEVFRSSLLTVVSALSGTGITSCNFMLWHPALWGVILLAMSVGGCSGSTTGGIKVVRLVVLVKNSYEEFKRLLHPRAIIPLKFNGKAVSPETVNSVIAFVMLYIGIALMAILIMMLMGVGPAESLGCSLSALGNVGLGYGAVVDGNFSVFATGPKLFMCLLMVLGRLELFTVLFVFTPAFWRH